MKKIENDPVILAVDDTTNILKILTHILKKNDYIVITASNGKEALEQINKTKPDLILLDIMMPEMDGFKTCEIIKNNPETKEIPVMFLTAKLETGDIIKGFQAGAVDYIKKPFNSAELLSRINTHIELKKARDKEKEHLKEIDGKNKRLEELGKLKDEFLGIAAHDIRNPIAAIKMSAMMLIEMIENNDIEENISIFKELLSEVEYLSDYMTHLLNELLDITSIESGNLHLNFKRESFIDFLNYNIKINTPLAARKDISIRLHCNTDLPEIKFDRNKMTQVMNNLISNAIKYSYPNTNIKIEVTRSDDYILTEIIDEGQGIPRDEMENLFKKFHKTSVKTTAGERSTGLGLAITKKIVEGHGGKINVTSIVNKGSTFYFTLPLN